VATYTYDLSDDKSCTYANRLMQYVIDDPADTLDETVWYYYDIEGNVERIVRKLDAEATYHSTKFVYNMGQSVRYVIGEEWDDDGLNWVRRETGGPAIEYLLTPSAMDWDDAVAYALSKGGVLASMYFEEDYDWVHGTFEPDSGYGEQRYWVGAYQDPNGNEPEPDGDWKWHLDGFPISPALYDPWQPGQPDDGGAGQCPPTNCTTWLNWFTSKPAPTASTTPTPRSSARPSSNASPEAARMPSTSPAPTPGNSATIALALATSVGSSTPIPFYPSTRRSKSGPTTTALASQPTSKSWTTRAQKPRRSATTAPE
jgi:hypothetical protein